jgi:hypothetical protein
MRTLLGLLLLGALLALPLGVQAAEESAEAEDASAEAITNHTLVAAVAALEGRTERLEAQYNSVIGHIAGLEADGPWHGSLTYRTEYVSGGPYGGFDQGVRVGLNYKENLLENLLVNIQMEFDTNNELFDKQLRYGGNSAIFDEGYLKYSN